MYQRHQNTFYSKGGKFREHNFLKLQIGSLYMVKVFNLW